MEPTNFLQSLGWAVLNSLWQLALLWLLYQLLTGLSRKARPAARSLLATVLLITGFGWFVFTFLSVFIAGGSESIFWGLTDASTSVNTWLTGILPVTSVMYLVLLFIPLFRFIRNYRYVQVIRQYGLSKPAPEWRLFVDKIARQMGIRKNVQVWISEWVTSPVTIGYLKPVILLPMAAVNQLSMPQMEAVLLHELSHIRRYDYLLNLVLNLIRTFLYFNPFARAFVKIVEGEREKSCDELVLQFQYDAYEYASALLSLEKLSREQQLLVLGAAGQGRELLGRIESIMGIQQKQKFSLRRFTSLLSAFCFILCLQTLFLLGSAVSAGNTHGYNSRVMTAPIAGLNSPSADLTADRLSSSVTRDKKQAPGENNVNTLKSLPLVALRTLAGNPAIIPASYTTIAEEPLPILEPEQEEVIRDAVATSRKVMESSQWKAIEKNLADVFTRKEKEEFKKALNQELNKFNWEQWENRLRAAYDKVNWEQVNTQLNEAVTQMRTDSLVRVYNDAMVNLSQAQKELSALSMKGIPDTDVTLRSIAEKQRQLQREVIRLKNARNKKIVHL